MIRNHLAYIVSIFFSEHLSPLPILKYQYHESDEERYRSIIIILSFAMIQQLLIVNHY